MELRSFCKEYSISETGKIFSVPRLNNRGQKIGGIFLKNKLSKNGYVIVGLNFDGKKKLEYVHRLVAAAFIPNPEQKATVNHKDLNKENNHYLNLEWATQQENNKHAIKNKRCDFKTEARMAHMVQMNKEKRILTPIMRIEINGLMGKMSQAKIAKRIGISPQTVMRFIKGNIYEEV